MFDISWTEFLLIAVVALIVIGPKELPGVMRSLGQWTRKVRSMAAEFQNQFQEAMREAELADLKKEVDEFARDVKTYDPLKDVRSDVEKSVATTTKDIEDALARPAAPAVEPAAAAEPAAGTATEAEAAAPAVPVERSALEAIGAETPVPAAPPAEPAVAPPDGTERLE